MERKKLEKLLAQNNYEDAYTYVNEITNEEKLKCEFLPLKGYIEFKLEKHEKAKSTLKMSLKKNPNSEESWKYLAEIYLNENMFQKAYVSYKMCVKKLGTTPYVCKRVLSLSMFLEKYEETKYYSKLFSTFLNMRSYKQIELIIKTHENNKKIAATNKENSRHSIVADNKDDINNLKNENKSTAYSKSTDNKTSYNLEKDLIKPNNRNELVGYVYELIENKEIEKAISLLQNAFYKQDTSEFAQHVIFIEWYDLLYNILVALSDTKYCMLKLNIANTIFYIFDKIKCSFYCLFFYLVEEKMFDELSSILSMQYYDIHIQNETKNIVKEILNIHPNYDLNNKECSCSSVDSIFSVLYNFNVKTYHIENYCK